jgi:predicted transcriptional regulator
MEKENLEKMLTRVIEMLEILLGKTELIIERLKKLEAQPSKIELTKVVELRPILLKVLKALATANKWVTPEELVKLIVGRKSEYNIAHRYLPALYQLGLVARQLNPEVSGKKRGYIYQLKLETLPEPLKYIVLKKSE